MRFRTLRGLSVLAMLVGAGMTAHAAPAAPVVNMAKLCSNGAYVLYMDDYGDQFETEAACVTWTKQHPGKPPIAIDDDPDEHPDQPDVDADDSDTQSDATVGDAADDTSSDTSDAATDDAEDTDATPVLQSTGKTVLVVVTAPDDAAAADDGEG
jgi:hypothetical protein